MHPLQGGYFRRKIRRHRRSALPRENPLVFYPRRVREIVETHAKLAAFYLYLHRIRRRVERDQRPYTDPALTPIPDQRTASPPRAKDPDRRRRLKFLDFRLSKELRYRTALKYWEQEDKTLNASGSQKSERSNVPLHHAPPARSTRRAIDQRCTSLGPS